MTLARILLTFLLISAGLPALLISAELPAPAGKKLEIASNPGAHSAMVATVMKEIGRELGLEVVVTPLPTVRATKEAGIGNYDGELLRPYSYGDSNPTMIRVDPPLAPVTIIGFTLESEGVKLESPEDFRKYKIGIVYGMSAIENFAAGHGNVELAPNQESLYKMLREKRFAVALDIGPSGRAEIHKRGYTGIAQFEMKRQHLHLYLHEKNRDLAGVIGGKIKELADSGRLAAMLEKAEQEYLAGLAVER